MDVQIVDYTRDLRQMKSKNSTHQALYFHSADCKKDSDEPCIRKRLHKRGFREKGWTMLQKWRLHGGRRVQTGEMDWRQLQQK